MQNKKPKSGQMFPKKQERVSQAIHLFPKKHQMFPKKNAVFPRFWNCVNRHIITN